MLPCKTTNLFDLGGRDIAREKSADSFALLVHFQHDLRCFLTPHLKELLQHEDHKFHGRVIVIQQDDPVHGRWFRLGLLFVENKTW